MTQGPHRLYLYICGGDKAIETLEHLDAAECGFKLANQDHRNFDGFMETTEPGNIFASCFTGAPSVRRRHDARLGVSRLPQLEMAGGERESFYEQRLFVGLPWYCDSKPEVRTLTGDKQIVVWRLKWHKPSPDSINGAVLDDETLEITNRPKSTDVSFEVACKLFERKFADPELDLLCPCCVGDLMESPCDACKFAVGFHYCRHPRSRRGFLQWRRGSLHNGSLDAQRVLWNLHRRQLPDDVLNQKIDLYIAEGLLNEVDAEPMRKCIEAERGRAPIDNVMGVDDGNADGAAPSGNRKLTPAQMEALLARRIEMMNAGAAPGAETDQGRVFRFIVECLQSDKPLRLMVLYFI